MLRSMTVSHNPSASAHSLPPQSGMNKDEAYIATTAPGYHNGLRDKENKTGVDSSQFESSERGVFQRYINQLAINNFGFTLQVAWEAVGLSFQLAWLNGGPAALVYGSIIAGIGSTLVATALGEMASMDPTVGAQYRWSARFAPFAPEFWGFIQGWITVIAWICSCAGAFSFMSNTLSGLIIFNSPGYEPKAWHSTVFLMAFLVIPVLLNLQLRRIINYLETIGGILHVVLFVAVVTTLCTLSKRSTPEFVFRTLHTDSGWENPGIAFSIGMLATAYPISSFDGVLHMIEETEKPRERVPKAMVLATFLNAIMMIAFCICLMFTIGDEEAVANSILPITEVFFSATGSKAASTALTVLMGFQLMIGNFNIVASVARLVWRFASDKGLPFHQHFTYIHPTLQVPIPALFLVGIVCCLLSLINLGSAAAFNSLISLPTIALYISYLVPIALLTARQLAGRHPKYGPFQLGKWSVPVKVCAMVYLVYVIVFVSFPATKPVTSLTMNYGPPILAGFLIIAMIDWFARGRNTFEVPTAALEHRGMH
ncbi:amino acid transporter [Plenodomus tracheiphilus IPT5]|uniref:Amino acid transporter n=1 Tax=Plenodomus tracheiphilus IPT5 TaxID=1408161 RepID=A0A6A7B0I4_9PLEO|nr:amino acid transporter [Plenodomus tracheiphilus IPT5]